MTTEQAKHCLGCGDTHSGDCHPSSFEHFKCSCGLLQKLPWDVVSLCGLDGMICGCGLEANDSWEMITHEAYEAEENERMAKEAN